VGQREELSSQDYWFCGKCQIPVPRKSWWDHKKAQHPDEYAAKMMAQNSDQKAEITSNELPKQEEDYWCCYTHEKKLDPFFLCPSKTSSDIPCQEFGRKSGFKEWQKKIMHINACDHAWRRKLSSSYKIFCMHCGCSPEDAGINIFPIASLDVAPVLKANDLLNK
jgi:hypothetical protein